MDNGFQAMLNLDVKNHFVDGGALSSYLKTYEIPNNQINSLFQMVKVRNKSVGMKNIIKKFNASLEIQKSERKAEEKYFSNKKIIENFQGEQLSLFKLLAEIFVALDAQNYAWVRKNLDKIASMDMQEVIFDIQPLYYDTNEEYEILFKKIIKLFQIVNEKIKESEELKLAVINLASFFEAEEFNQLKKEFDANWSLTDIRERIKKGIKPRHLGLWYKLISQRGSDAEIQKLLNQYLTGRSLKRLPLIALRLLTQFYPPQDNDREQALGKIKKLVRSNVLFDRYIVLELLKNNIIKRSLAEESLKKATFQLEREFYRDTLFNGIAIQFSLYNLIQLGDLDDSLLWWLLL